MVHKEILPNKTRLFTVPLKATKTVTMLVMYPVGSRYETNELSGASHFIEHLMFKGTERRPKPMDISRALDGLGAEYNAFTSKDYTGYYVTASAEKLAQAGDIIVDMLHHSHFAQEEMEREKNVVIEEINMYKDNPTMVVEEYFEELIFPRHPLGRYIGGTAEVIRAMTRDQILSYRDRFYAPSNAIVVVAGAIDGRKMQVVKKLFSAQTGARAVKKISYERCPRPGVRSARARISLHFKETDQAHMVLGFPGPHLGDPLMPVASVLNTIVGGSMSSRLFDVVREQKGLAYMVRSGMSSYQDVGTFTVQTGLTRGRIEEAIKAIKEELRRLQKEPVGGEELARVKDHIVGRSILDMEESSFWANWYGKQALLINRLDSPEDKLKKIRAVTSAQVRRMAQKLFDFSKMHIAVIGPYKDAKLFVKLVS